MEKRVDIKPSQSYPCYGSFVDLGEALQDLGEMMHVPETETSYVKEATMQRFKWR